jgi:heme/copper-type cytochrome/quinol oxidase subunit 2
MSVEEMNTQAGGVFEMYILGINVWWFIGIVAALVIGAGIAAAVVLRKRKKKQG